MLTRDVIEHDFWQIIHQNIGKFANKIAIKTKNQAITYHALNQYANRIANAIDHKNVGDGNGIGLLIRDGIKTSASIIGVMKSQNYAITLDPNFPRARLQNLIQDSQVRILLTDDVSLPLADNIILGGVDILNIDAIDSYPATLNKDVFSTPHQIINIIYTAGSTGDSKGVIEDYRFLSRVITHQINLHRLSSDERVITLNSFAFTGPHIWLFISLIAGATLYYFNVQEEGFSGLSDWINNEQITYFNSTCTVFRNFVKTLKPDEKFPKVRIVRIGGEKRLEQDVAAFKRHFSPGCEFGVGFASTETQVVSYRVYKNDFEFIDGILPVGYPLDDVDILICDEEGVEQAVGELGEIVIRGDALARGYWNRPELNNLKFHKDSQNPEVTIYHSGDLGRILPDGQLQHLGRIDDLVKIKGIRIELANVVNHLLAYPGVVQATARSFEDSKNNLKLVGYVVPEAGASISTSDLRKFLSDRLPLHSIPHFLLTVPVIPMTPAGKIDKQALPLPNLHRPELANSFMPPNGDLEKRLVELWEENIGITGIGVTDDYFELGGDSLSAVMLFVEIEKRFDKKLPISVLLTHSTIRNLGSLITSKAEDEFWDIVVPLRKQGEGLPVFFIPGKGGYPIRFHHLAQKISCDNPLYALQIWWGGKKPRFFSTIEETASLYLEEIRNYFPTGPYHFCGESLGGTIAYEMAQQLLKKGEQVPVLVMFDTYGPEQKGMLQFPDDKSTKKDYYAMLIRKHTQILLHSDLAGKVSYIGYYWKLFINKMINLQKKYLPKISGGEAIDVFEQNRIIELVSTTASKLYQPKPYPGRVILFRAQRNPSSIDPTNGWDKVDLGELVVHNLDCYHGNILFEPAVSQVTKYLEDYLAEQEDK